MKKSVLFNLGGATKLAKEVVAALSSNSNIEIGSIEFSCFADSEIKVRALNDVKDRNVIILAATSAPVNDHLMEVLILADGLKRAGASTITLISPYFGYSRQDRIGDNNDPITLKLVASLLRTAGVNKLFCIDPHTEYSPDYFDLAFIPISGDSAFAKYFVKKFSAMHIPNNNVVVLSPDHGGINRGKHLASSIEGAGFAVIEKQRAQTDRIKVVSFHGEVQNKTVIIFDDIISTGQTIMEAVRLSREKGAKRVFVAASHPVFSSRSNEMFYKAKLDGIVVSDSIDSQLMRGVEVISFKDIVLNVIRDLV